MTGSSAPHLALCFLSQISTTVRATPVKTAARASTVLTPTSVSVVTAGRACTVRTVSAAALGDRWLQGGGRAGLAPSLGGKPLFYCRDFYYGGYSDLLYLLGV